MSLSATDRRTKESENGLDDRFELHPMDGRPSMMSPLSNPGGPHAEGTGYSSRGCRCPRCEGPASRIPRRLVDLLMSMFVTVNRYRCDSPSCGWEGNVRVKRHPILVQGPW